MSQQPGEPSQAGRSGAGPPVAPEPVGTGAGEPPAADPPGPWQRAGSAQQAVEAVVRSASQTLLLVSGGEHAGDEAMLEKAHQSIEAGATGLIFGRNVFQRRHDESLRLVAQLKELLAKYLS